MKIFLFNPLYRFPINNKSEKYFIRSGSRWPHSGIKHKNDLPHYIPFPFFLAYSAAWLKKSGFEVITCDCVALNMSLNEMIELAKKENPDIFFFETTTPTINHDISLAKEIKESLPKSIMILGGPHTSVYPKAIIEENSSIDFILSGEYEEILLNLTKAIKYKSDLTSVKGITYRDKNDVIISTENPGLIDPLNKLPEPAYDMFPSSWQPDPTVYWDGFCQHKPTIQMHASRGCPYKCDFCLWNQVMYKNGKYRTFSAKRIVDEMEKMVKLYKAKEIYFDDDDFTINGNQVKEICETIISRKFKIKWSCMGDAINLNENLLDLMAESGCVGIKFGVETGSARMIKNLGKPLDLEKVKQLTKWCAKRKIKTHATFSLGLSGDDNKSTEETIDYLVNLDADTIQVSISTPFPGTEFFNYAKKNNLLKTKDWEKYDGKASEVTRHKIIDLNEIEKLRSIALKKWLFKRLTSLKWLLRQVYYFIRILKGIGPKFISKQVYSLLMEEMFISQIPKKKKVL